MKLEIANLRSRIKIKHWYLRMPGAAIHILEIVVVMIDCLAAVTLCPNLFPSLSTITTPSEI